MTKKKRIVELCTDGCKEAVDTGWLGLAAVRERQAKMTNRIKKETKMPVKSQMGANVAIA